MSSGFWCLCVYIPEFKFWWRHRDFWIVFWRPTKGSLSPRNMWSKHSPGSRLFQQENLQLRMWSRYSYQHLYFNRCILYRVHIWSPYEGEKSSYFQSCTGYFDCKSSFKYATLLDDGRMLYNERRSVDTPSFTNLNVSKSSFCFTQEIQSLVLYFRNVHQIVHAFDSDTREILYAFQQTN